MTRCCYLGKQKALPGTCNSIKFRVLLSSFQSFPPSLQLEIKCVDYRDAQTGVRWNHLLIHQTFIDSWENRLHPGLLSSSNFHPVRWLNNCHVTRSLQPCITPRTPPCLHLSRVRSFFLCFSCVQRHHHSERSLRTCYFSACLLLKI